MKGGGGREACPVQTAAVNGHVLRDVRRKSGKVRGAGARCAGPRKVGGAGARCAAQASHGGRPAARRCRTALPTENYIVHSQCGARFGDKIRLRPAPAILSPGAQGGPCCCDVREGVRGRACALRLTSGKIQQEEKVVECMTMGENTK